MPPLHIPVKPSRLVLSLLVGLHAAAVAGIALSGLDVRWKVGLLVLVAASFVIHMRRYVWRRGACAVAEMTLNPNRQWTLQMTDGRLTRAELLRARVFRFLVILEFQTRYGRCSVLVPPDALDRETHRRLRIVLLQSGRGERRG